MASVTDRCRGVLLGLAAGDRNGGPIRMALRLAQSLLACRRLDTQDLVQCYLSWWSEDGIDSGPTTARVLELIEGGASPAQAVEQVHTESAGLTAGCNPAHRSGPLAMAAFIPDEDLAGAALREAALTHRHPLAGDAASAVVVLCRGLIRGEKWADALDSAATGRLDETRQALSAGAHRPGGRDGYAPTVLQAAVYFVANSSTFDRALSDALDFAGPANYCPVLVGAVAGARWGAAAIPPAALGHPRLSGIEDEVELTAASLAGSWPADVRQE